MREVEKSEGNYMSRERPIGNLGDRIQSNQKVDETVPCDFRGGKKQKKNVRCLLHTRCLRYFLLLLLLL